MQQNMNKPLLDGVELPTYEGKQLLKVICVTIADEGVASYKCINEDGDRVDVPPSVFGGN